MNNEEEIQKAISTIKKRIQSFEVMERAARRKLREQRKKKLIARQMDRAERQRLREEKKSRIAWNKKARKEKPKDYTYKGKKNLMPPEPRNNGGGVRKGFVHSEETKRKISESGKGKLRGHTVVEVRTDPDEYDKFGIEGDGARISQPGHGPLLFEERNPYAPGFDEIKDHDRVSELWSNPTIPIDETFKAISNDPHLWSNPYRKYKESR